MKLSSLSYVINRGQISVHHQRLYSPYTPYTTYGWIHAHLVALLSILVNAQLYTLFLGRALTEILDPPSSDTGEFRSASVPQYI